MTCRHDKFVTNEWMKDLMHKYDSNKPKSLNGFLTTSISVIMSLGHNSVTFLKEYVTL
jgi:hypothetical protein